MAVTGIRNANTSPSKRSFDELRYHEPESEYDYYTCFPRHAQVRPKQSRSDFQHPSTPPLKRRSAVPDRSHSLPSNRCLIMSATYPSLMTILGSEEANSPEPYTPIQLEHNLTAKSQHEMLLMDSYQPLKYLRHHKIPDPSSQCDSVPSLYAESAQSSPTTTSSTFDSPLVFENSTTSSPESATSMQPPTPDRNIITRKETPTTGMCMVQEQPKNVKKLTLDMNSKRVQQPTIDELNRPPCQPFSAPTSPQKEPLKSARRKPNNLTIRTPGFNQLSFAPLRTGNNVVPPTPSQRPMLHQFPSSPALHSLASPKDPPRSGMRLPILNTSSAHSHLPGGNRTSLAMANLPELREDMSAIPKSGEAPERGYTEGPIRIYDSEVYLYLEPTAEEASRFDTVINVAKEVRNPFQERGSSEKSVAALWREENARRDTPEPQTAISDYSFRTASEWPSRQSIVENVSPPQSPITQQKAEPEYLHVPWDHNSEILDDLPALCQLIDDRVRMGKKVLVHCQLGVSRSASLIIAYGLWKSFQPNFHQMYMAVKERSRWISPNMTLIMQLNDFKNRVNKGTYTGRGFSANADWFVRTPVVPDMKPDPSTAIKQIQHVNSAPPEAPAGQTIQVTQLRLNKVLPPVPLFSDQKPGSSLTTSGESVARVKTPTTVKRTASRPLPFREREMTIPAHRPQMVPGRTVPPTQMDLAMTDVPSTPSLFSPRATEFIATPFNIKGAGDLARPGNRQSTEIPKNFSWLSQRPGYGHLRTASKDPRSPHHKEEPREIFRSIDGYL